MHKAIAVGVLFLVCSLIAPELRAGCCPHAVSAETGVRRAVEERTEVFRKCVELAEEAQARLDRYSSEKGLSASQLLVSPRIEELRRGRFNVVYGIKCMLDLRSSDERFYFVSKKSERFSSELSCAQLYSENEQDRPAMATQYVEHDRRALGFGKKFCRVRWTEVRRAPGR